MKISTGDYLTDSTRDPLETPTRRELCIVGGAAILAALLLALSSHLNAGPDARWLGTLLAASAVSTGCLWGLVAMVRRRAGTNPTPSSLVLLLLVFVGGFGPPLIVFAGLALDSVGGDDPYFGHKGFAWAAFAIVGPALELAWRYWHVNSMRRRQSLLQSEDAEERAHELATLEKLAFHDALTGLANRRQFERALSACVDASSPGAPAAQYAVMFLDFDKFKHINDTHGHATGDEFLVSVGRRLQALVRTNDLVARLGGDEFAILVRGEAVAETALAVAERIVQTMAEPFELASACLRSSASIGISIANGSVTTVEAVVHEADVAMYRAKKAGGARFSVAGRLLDQDQLGQH